MGFFSTAKAAPVANPPPANEQELADVIATTRALLDDASEVDRLLRVGGEEPLTAGQVRRWLSGRDWEPARAARDLAAHAAWRAQYAPQGRVLDCEVANELAQNKVLIQGLDRNGRAVIMVLGAQHVPR
ncbi:hypothetical protein MNEG_8006 [Monoraphidium neglectum]|uniref:CRAL/TRIO N-terminal domain-containing protein n=1 Tax=Monoraphidium neglectum TaxID=145388 RepID=A0A0D2MGX7_9CHLO|nr:hypothetical protein MNEG_8006 [Monoraphidium neglectum]KIY99951.1 hypothetical protein MNEG_8006 [Monoraphidium neglectum]|eukprot:XP_013898971.1 hypothetical protein MNEG_8006 [Monoraphidium neglectum]